VEVIGQDHAGIDPERVPFKHISECISEKGDVCGMREERLACKGHSRKKESTPGNVYAPIVHLSMGRIGYEYHTSEKTNNQHFSADGEIPISFEGGSLFICFSESVNLREGYTMDNFVQSLTFRVTPLMGTRRSF
jgi:hypothetical protein